MTIFDSNCLRALGLARLSAAERWAPLIEPEDLLAACVATPGPGAALLRELGIDPGAIARSCRRHLPRGGPAALPRSGRAVRTRRVEELPAAVRVNVSAGPDQLGGTAAWEHVEQLAQRGALFALVDVSRLRRFEPTTRVDRIGRAARLYRERGGRLVLVGARPALVAAVGSALPEVAIHTDDADAHARISGEIALGSLPRTSDPWALPWSIHARRALERAVAAAAGGGCGATDTGDVLLSLYQQGAQRVRRSLEDAGLAGLAIERALAHTRRAADGGRAPAPLDVSADLAGLREQTLDVQVQLAEVAAGAHGARDRLGRIERLGLAATLAGIAAAVGAAAAAAWLGSTG